MRARVTSDFLIEVAVVIVLNVFENRMPRAVRHVKDYLNAFIFGLGLIWALARGRYHTLNDSICTQLGTQLHPIRCWREYQVHLIQYSFYLNIV